MRRDLLSGALILAVAMLAACGERTEVFYEDAADARRAGSVERGWIPGWLPGSARDIREIHDLDTNQGMLALSFDPADVPHLEASCEPVGAAQLRPAPFPVAWWPDDVPPSGFGTHRHVFYRCEDGGYVAVETKAGKLFRWRP